MPPTPERDWHSSCKRASGSSNLPGGFRGTPACSALDDRGRPTAGHEVVALATCVRLAPAVLRGGDGNRSRRVPRTRGARANRVRPIRGSARDELADDARPHGGEQRSRPNVPPWSKSRMAVCRTVGPRASRGGGVSRSGSRSRSADLVSRSDAGASPACGLVRVAQRTERPPSKRMRMQVRLLPRPSCPCRLSDRIVVREATGDGSNPHRGIGRVV